MTDPFTVEPYSDKFERVTCPRCNFIWQEDKPLPTVLKCPACKYSGEAAR